MNLRDRRLKRALLLLGVLLYFLVIPIPLVILGMILDPEDSGQMPYLLQHLMSCLVLIFPLVIGFIIWQGIRQSQYRKRSAARLTVRAEAMKRLAAELGLQYEQGLQPHERLAWNATGLRSPSDIGGARPKDFYHIWKTHNGYPFNMLSGTCDGLRVDLFDYHEFSTQGHEEVSIPFFVKSRITETNPGDTSVAILEMDRPLPTLVVYPEGLWDAAVKRLGGIDVDLESFEFSESYRVWSKDREFAYAFCHPRMMEFLMRSPDLSLKVEGNVLALRFPELVPVNQLAKCIDTLFDVLGLVPDHAGE